VAARAWPAASYGDWRATCDTLHAHTQVLGKIAAELGFAEPDFQHVALRLTARGWETRTLRAPDGSGAIVVALDLRSHEAIVEHSDGRRRAVALAPDRAVADVTGELLAAASALAGEVGIDPAPAEVPWTVPLDRDRDHSTYDPEQVAAYHAAATQAAMVLADFRAPHPGPSTPVNAWWGSFDLAVSLFSRELEFALGWWPGDPKYPRAAFYAYAKPAPPGFERGQVDPESARWEADLGIFVLDWDEVRAAPDPHALALEFARSAFDRTRSLAGRP
jgi:hypothetical protein